MEVEVEQQPVVKSKLSLLHIRPLLSVMNHRPFQVLSHVLSSVSMAKGLTCSSLLYEEEATQSIKITTFTRSNCIILASNCI